MAGEGGGQVEPGQAAWFAPGAAAEGGGGDQRPCHLHRGERPHHHRTGFQSDFLIFVPPHENLLRSTRSTLHPLTPCLRSQNGGEGSPPPSSPSSPPATWSTSGWSAATGRRCRRTCSSSRTPPPTSARCWPTPPGTPRRTPSPSPSLTGTATLSGSSCPPSIRDNCLKVC